MHIRTLMALVRIEHLRTQDEADITLSIDSVFQLIHLALCDAWNLMCAIASQITWSHAFTAEV